MAVSTTSLIIERRTALRSSRLVISPSSTFLASSSRLISTETSWDFRPLVEVYTVFVTGPPVPLDAFSESDLNSFKFRAHELVSEKFTATSLFGVKDPQITRLLPFWRNVFSRLSIEDSYIISCRNPKSVALSLEKYCGFDLEKCYLIWFIFTLDALINTCGASRVVVSYDLLMQNPSHQLQRIAHCLGLQFDARSDKFIEYQLEFLEGGLRHTEYSQADLLADGTIPPMCISLYKFLLNLSMDTILIESQEALKKINKFHLLRHDRCSLLKYIQTLNDRLTATHSKIAEESRRNKIEESRRNKIEESLMAKIERLEAQLAEVTLHNESLAEELCEVYTSRSWMITRLLRKGEMLCSKLWHRR